MDEVYKYSINIHYIEKDIAVLSKVLQLDYASIKKGIGELIDQDCERFGLGESLDLCKQKQEIG